MMHRTALASLALAAVLAPQAALGASLAFEQRGGVVHVLVDAGGTSLNAFEGSVRVSGARVSDVLLGSSIIPLWVKRPVSGDLSFAGVVPGGYDGARGELFAFQLSGTPGSSARVEVENLSVLANDGAGTSVDTASAPATFTLSGNAGPILDRDPPEFSEVVVDRSDALFGGDWFVAFNAQDAVTGVQRFEVAERIPGIGAGEPEWRPATSPYRLEDQSRRSEILVRAVDGAGNEATHVVAPEATSPVYGYVLLGALALAALVALGVGASKVRSSKARR